MLTQTKTHMHTQTRARARTRVHTKESQLLGNRKIQHNVV